MPLRPRSPAAPVTSRAVLGGLLVLAAAALAYVAATSASAAPSDRWVVAAQAVAPGQALTEADLRLVPIDLPADVAGQAMGEPAEAIGAVATAPLEPGALVMRSTLRPEAGGPAEVTIAVAEPVGLVERLHPGERVELVATLGTGPEASTTSVTEATIVAVQAPGGGLHDGRASLTVAVDDASAAVDAVHAAQAGTVSVVRHGSGSG